MQANSPALPPLLAGRRRIWLAALIGHALLQASLAFALAWGVRALIDGAWHPGAALALLIALGSVRAVLQHTQVVQAEALAQHYIAHLRLRLFDGLSTLTSAGMQRRSRGALMLRFMGDVQAMRAWVGRGIAACVASGASLLALLLALVWLDLRLAALTLAWVLLAALLMGRTLPPLQSALRESRRQQARVAAQMHDQINGLDVVQCALQAATERRRLQRLNRRLRCALQQRARASARHRLLLGLVLTGLATSVLAWLVAWPATSGLPAQTAAGALGGSAGTLVGALGLVGLLATPLRHLGRALESRCAAQVARERMLEFLADPDRLVSPLNGPSVAAHATLSFEAAALSPRLAPFTAKATAGQRICVRGPSGSGKSTLLAMAARVLDPDSGTVTLGGHDLKHLELRTVRRHVSLLTTQHGLLRGSVGSNLRYRSASASAADRARACALAGWPTAPSDADLRRPVRDGGSNLGGDERRRLALARALLDAPAVLVIDEVEHCLPAPARQSLEHLARHFEGTLIYSSGSDDLCDVADVCWHLGRDRLLAPLSKPASTPIPRSAVTLRLVGPRPSTGSNTP